MGIIAPEFAYLEPRLMDNTQGAGGHSRARVPDPSQSHTGEVDGETLEHSCTDIEGLHDLRWGM